MAGAVWIRCFLLFVLAAWPEAEVQAQKNVLVYLNCDARCEAVFAGLRLAGGRLIMAAGSSRGGRWSAVEDEQARPLEFLNGTDQRNLVAVADGKDIVQLDLQAGSTRLLHAHAGRVFYPVLAQGALYFSDATVSAPGAVNRYQGRRLLRVDLQRKLTERGLQPWLGYALGFPSVTDDGRICLSMVLPRSEQALAAGGPVRGRTSSAYCFSLALAFGPPIDGDALEAAALFRPAARLQDLVVDARGRFASGFNHEVSPAAWVVIDIPAARILRQIPSRGGDRLALSRDGSRFVHAWLDGDRLAGRIHDAASGAVLHEFSADLRQLNKLATRRS